MKAVGVSRHALPDADQAGAQQGLTAGEADLLDAQQGDRDADQADDLAVRGPVGDPFPHPAGWPGPRTPPAQPPLASLPRAQPSTWLGGLLPVAMVAARTSKAMPSAAALSATASEDSLALPTTSSSCRWMALF